jgi:flagellar basal-body rod modification protein FlgD
MTSTTAPSNTTTNPFLAVNASSSSSASSSSNSSSLASSTSAVGTQSAFLKLLTTQMQNQDPLNPMDNAQITSQIAQINTVNGIQQLNTTVSGLNTQFLQMQTLQGAALVGHNVTVAGNRLAVSDGAGVGGFQLTNPADDVKVKVMDSTGKVVDTLDLGAQAAGNQSFNWNAANVPNGANYTFSVSATSGNTALSVTPLMQDQVQSVTSGTNGLSLNTEYSGSVPFSSIVAFD